MSVESTSITTRRLARRSSPDGCTATSIRVRRGDRGQPRRGRRSARHRTPRARGRSPGSGPAGRCGRCSRRGRRARRRRAASASGRIGSATTETCSRPRRRGSSSSWPALDLDGHAERRPDRPHPVVPQRRRASCLGSAAPAGRRGRDGRGSPPARRRGPCEPVAAQRGEQLRGDAGPVPPAQRDQQRLVGSRPVGHGAGARPARAGRRRPARAGPRARPGRARGGGARRASRWSSRLDRRARAADRGQQALGAVEQLVRPRVHARRGGEVRAGHGRGRLGVAGASSSASAPAASSTASRSARLAADDTLRWPAAAGTSDHTCQCTSEPEIAPGTVGHEAEPQVWHHHGLAGCDRSLGERARPGHAERVAGHGQRHPEGAGAPAARSRPSATASVTRLRLAGKAGHAVHAGRRRSPRPPRRGWSGPSSTACAPQRERHRRQRRRWLRSRLRRGRGHRSSVGVARSVPRVRPGTAPWRGVGVA